MDMVKIEMKELRKDNVALLKDNMALQNQLAEYRRKYGNLNGTGAKK